MNYAYLSGAFKGQLQNVAYVLARKGIIDFDKVDEVDEVCKELIERAEADTAQYEKEYENKD
jgi:transcriptional/translational regulatory protein YebC/TACO1